MNKEKKEHLKWMLDNLPKEYTKRSRWIGFIQGTLWSYDIRTIDEMRYDVIVDVNNANKTLDHTIGILRNIISSL